MHLLYQQIHYTMFIWNITDINANEKAPTETKNTIKQVRTTRTELITEKHRPNIVIIWMRPYDTSTTTKG